MQMNKNIKNILKNAGLILGGVLLVCFIILLIYMLLIYFEFLGSRELIFGKIDDFSEALKIANETDIVLGMDDLEDKESSYIYDRYGKIIAKYSPEKHKLIQIYHIPYYVSRGFFLIEDNRFYKHHGINIVRLSIAIMKNVFSFGKSPGGSTITQQLGKILFTKHERTIKRKVFELYCTLELERRFSKNEILQIYLNSIYMGHGIYGIANASEFYFGKDASELTIAEAALFIGMNRAPELYSPIKHPDNAKRVQKIVMNQFVKENFLTKEESEMEIERFWKRFNEHGISGNQSFWKTEINRSGYITEYIRQIVDKELDYEKITQGGLKIETTIDLERQLLAERIIKERIKYIRKKIKEKAEKDGVKDYDENKIEVSFSSINYKQGEILVLVGGSGYSFANQFNRAVYGLRQTGSSIKPLIYAKALSDQEIKGRPIHPFSKFLDDIVEYKINGKVYKPRNYHANHKYGNMVTLYDALKTSLNTVPIAVLNEMKIKPVAEFVRKAAFLYTDSDRKRVPEVLSLALGTCELSSLELATAYSVFCRGGKSMYPYVIRKIYDSKGTVYYDYERENNPLFNDLWPKEHREPEQILEPEVAYEIVQMMKSVFEKGGTGSWPAYVTGFNVPAYGKSGTSQEFKDGWFAGFTHDEVAACWVGHDENKTTYIPGASGAGIIWCDYIQRASSGITQPIEKPRNMRLIKVCLDSGMIATGKCPDTKEFYFWRDGPMPDTKCYQHPDDIFLEVE